MQITFSDAFLCTPKKIPKNSKNLGDSIHIRMTMPNTAKHKINANYFFRRFSLHTKKNPKKFQKSG